MTLWMFARAGYTHGGKDVELANALNDDLRPRVDVIERVLLSMIAADILQSKDFANDIASDYTKFPEKRGRSYIGRRAEEAVLMPAKPSELGRRARGERVYIGKRTVSE